MNAVPLPNETQHMHTCAESIPGCFSWSHSSTIAHWFAVICPVQVKRLESYLSYLQEYQNPMVTRAWPINTNFVGNNETVTDTVFLKSMRKYFCTTFALSVWCCLYRHDESICTPSMVEIMAHIDYISWIRTSCTSTSFAYTFEIFFFAPLLWWLALLKCVT